MRAPRPAFPPSTRLPATPSTSAASSITHCSSPLSTPTTAAAIAPVPAGGSNTSMPNTAHAASVKHSAAGALLLLGCVLLCAGGALACGLGSVPGSLRLVITEVVFAVAAHLKFILQS